MLPDEVREAMERLTEPTPCDYETYKTIRAHLLAREAEVERLRRELVVTRDCCRNVADEFAKQRDRAERAEALLRECLSRLGPEWTRGNIPINPDASLHNRITAILLEKDNGPLRK